MSRFKLGALMCESFSLSELVLWTKGGRAWMERGKGTRDYVWLQVRCPDVRVFFFIRVGSSDQEGRAWMSVAHTCQVGQRGARPSQGSSDMAEMGGFERRRFDIKNVSICYI